jgi:hypothetical protein
MYDAQGMSASRKSRAYRSRAIAWCIAVSAASIFTLAYRLIERNGLVADRAAIALKLGELAELGGVGLPPHAVTSSGLSMLFPGSMDKVNSAGEFPGFKTDFKAAREIDPSLHSHKAWDARANRERGR